MTSNYLRILLINEYKPTNNQKTHTNLGVETDEERDKFGFLFVLNNLWFRKSIFEWIFRFSVSFEISPKKKLQEDPHNTHDHSLSTDTGNY